MWKGICWLAGVETSPPAQPPGDTLEPYCSAEVLQHRLHDAGAVPMGTHKAIHKIGARYGVRL